MNVRVVVGASRSRRYAISIIAVMLIGACWARNAAPAQAHVPYGATAWGSNLSGQLGVGSEFGPEQCTTYQLACATIPVQLSGFSNLYAMSGGEEHTLAVQATGAVSSWGSNEGEQLGDGLSAKTQTESDVPVGVCAPNNCASGMGGYAVAAGGQHSLALGGSGTVYSWGSNEAGQLGDGFDGITWGRTTPIAVSKLAPAVGIAAGEEHSVALLSNHTIRTWGNNELGQLGTGLNASNKDLPTAVVFHRNPLKEVTGVTAVASGASHGIGLIPGAGVIAWGSNNHGQLGDYINTGPETCEGGPCSKVAVWVAGARKAPPVALAAGGDHNLALLEDGTVVAWGANASGQLGDGTTTDKYEMVAVKGLSNVVAIAAGEKHSIALLANGTVMAWGANAEGQLGVGNSTGPETCGEANEPCSRTPVAVAGLSAMDVKSIAAGGRHSLAFGPPNPTVTAVSPSQGLSGGGTSVTITGTELTGVTAVRFGSANASTYTVESATTITAVSPPGSGTVDVTVTTPEGTSPTNPADQFTYSLTGAATRAAPQQPSTTRLRGAQPASGSSNTASLAPESGARIIGVNLGGFFAAEPKEGEKWTEPKEWEKLLQGSVRSIRVEASNFAKQAAEAKVLVGAEERKFEHMACIVGNGKSSARKPWRTAAQEPTLRVAMKDLGGGNEAEGVKKWEEGALEEVEECAHTSAVAVIEITNEPWALVGGEPNTLLTKKENAALYGRMCAGLLGKIKEKPELSKAVTMLASVDRKDFSGRSWLIPMFTAGGPVFREGLGGLSAHPYGKAALGARNVTTMLKQQAYANMNVYVTEYGRTAPTIGEEVRQWKETQRMFEILKTLSWVRGIWYYDFVDAAETHFGWYPQFSTQPPEWGRERAVKDIVEDFAEEPTP
jgi:alpha-tubulin suppressor-like RCC1 family protein